MKRKKAGVQAAGKLAHRAVNRPWKSPPPNEIKVLTKAEAENYNDNTRAVEPSICKAASVTSVYEDYEPSHLRDRALAGSSFAIALIVLHARQLINVLNELADEHIELLRPHAERASSWPAQAGWQALKWEADLKAIKERKARAAVPKF